MKTLLLLARLRLLDTLRSKSSAGFVFAFPVVLLIVVGLVFMKGHPFEQRRVAVVAPKGADVQLAQRLATYSEVYLQREATQAAALGKLRSRMTSAVLILERSPGKAPFRLVVSERDKLLAKGIESVLEGQAHIEVLKVPKWGYVHYLFPGMLTFSMLLSGLFGMGYAMVLYRQSLFLKKLATTPLSKSTFVAAQLLARTLLVIAQNVLLVFSAYLFFDMPFTLVGLLWLSGFTVLGLLTFMGVGFGLACVIKTEELMVDIISAINIPIIFLSELFFPLDALPRALELVGSVLPSTVMVRLCRSVLLYGVSDPVALLPGVLLLFAWAAVTFAVSVRIFKWHG